VLGKTRMVMAHGDGVWKRGIMFPLVRALFRNKLCQKLYSAIHPRWTVPFAYRWSSYSRHEGEDELREREKIRERMKREGSGIPENIRQLAAYSNNYTESLRLQGEDVLPSYYLYGHLHEVVEERLECGAEMLVIGDWLVKNSYAVYDGETMSLQYHNERALNKKG
ncbi:MAG: hypothetical protein K2H86_07475, partial [Muribaculaceae bacterium]|nr:hypothetical protein [Muribaculaceae bacterium]